MLVVAADFRMCTMSPATGGEFDETDVRECDTETLGSDAAMFTNRGREGESMVTMVLLRGAGGVVGERLFANVFKADPGEEIRTSFEALWNPRGFVDNGVCGDVFVGEMVVTVLLSPLSRGFVDA